MKKIEVRNVRSLTEEELSELYGERKIEIGKTFKLDEYKNNHFYMQRENDVLHIFNEIVNTSYVSSLNNRENLIEVTHEEFRLELNRIIYNLNITELLHD
jgi:hypothetical protein